jgi:hypothetical protein
LADELGADEIYLLGYDCSLKNGLHWHGKHDGKLTNCDSIKEWPSIFARVSRQVDAKVYNCSRYTELKCFEKLELEQVC